MKLNFNKIQQLNSNQLYNILLVNIKNIKSKFEYIEINDIYPELVLTLVPRKNLTLKNNGDKNE